MGLTSVIAGLATPKSLGAANYLVGNDGRLWQTTALWAQADRHVSALSKLEFLDSAATLGDALRELLPDAIGGSVALVRLVRSYDPNDKVTIGYGSQGFVQPDVVLPYTVRFENVPTATAPAQEVVITDTLDPRLNLDTFELIDFAFGDHVVQVPPGLSDFQTRVDLRPEGTDCVVDVIISLDRSTRQLRAHLIARDPDTGWLPDDFNVGILPPNDATGRGEGHVGYRVRPIGGLPSGTAIPNQARIVFDYNDPIETPRVVNTIDAEPPESRVNPLPPLVGGAFPVSWTGDDGAGSGVARYDIWVSVDDGPFALWLEDTEATSAEYPGQEGHTYAFYSVAMDHVGHREGDAARADAETVGGAGLLILSALTPNPSGFVAEFTQPIDPAALSLYDVESGAQGAADVTLVGAATGQIRGSLIVEPTRVTFVATGGVLPADDYTVLIRSAEDAFRHQTLGALLDGNADGSPGGDCVRAFSIHSAQPRVISLPDFARGPGQSIDVRATQAGLPLTISEAAGIEAVDLTIVYDPALLTVTGATTGADAPPGSSVTANTAVPGQVRLSFFSPTPMAAGAAKIVSLQARVPETAEYRSAHLLEITSVLIDEGAVGAVADDAVHSVVYLGDTTGNGSYSGLDAQRIARVVVQLDSGFEAHPRIDPAIIGDATFSGGLSGLDAVFVAREVVGLDQPEIPPLPGAPAPPQSPAPSGPDGELGRFVEQVDRALAADEFPSRAPHDDLASGDAWRDDTQVAYSLPDGLWTFSVASTPVRQAQPDLRCTAGGSCARAARIAGVDDNRWSTPALRRGVLNAAAVDEILASKANSNDELTRELESQLDLRSLGAFER